MIRGKLYLLLYRYYFDNQKCIVISKTIYAYFVFNKLRTYGLFLSPVRRRMFVIPDFLTCSCRDGNATSQFSYRYIVSLSNTVIIHYYLIDVSDKKYIHISTYMFILKVIEKIKNIFSKGDKTQPVVEL